MSWIPVTPAGTPVTGLASDTYQEAVRRLLIDAAHMPYGNWEMFQQRGYTIEEFPEFPAENPPQWCGSGMATQTSRVSGKSKNRSNTSKERK